MKKIAVLLICSFLLVMPIAFAYPNNIFFNFFANIFKGISDFTNKRGAYQVVSVQQFKENPQFIKVPPNVQRDYIAPNNVQYDYSLNPIRVYIAPNVDYSNFMKLKKISKESWQGDVKITERYYVFDGLKTINLNPKYLEGVRKIELFSTLSVCGYYHLATPKGGEIQLNMRCSNNTRIFLHELKHNYCWRNNGNQEAGHNGCFLDTPIDKEYGFIK